MRSPTLYFRGNRKYLHSTTLFDAFCEFHSSEFGSAPTEIDFIFNLPTNCQIVIVDASNHAQEKVVANFKSSTGEFCAISTDDEIEITEEFDETELAKNFSIDQDLITIVQNTNYSFIDHVVSSFKLLAQKHSNGGDLAFARLMLSAVPQGEFTVEYRRLFNRRFHEGSISSPCGTSGKIYFGEWAS